MATKPTERILDWASGGTKTDPGAGKEAAGWIANDRPPGNWWNYILSSFGKWISYADEAIDEKLNEVSPESLVFSGRATDAIAAVQQLDNSTVSDAVRIAILKSVKNSQQVWVYTTESGLEIACNASWNGSAWVSAGSDEGLIQISAAGTSSNISLFKNLSGGGFLERFSIQGDIDSSPASPLSNSVYPIAVPKVVGTVTVSGGTPTISTNSIGLGTPSIVAQQVRVPFGTSFASTDYHAVVTPVGSSTARYGLGVINSATSYCSVDYQELNGTTPGQWDALDAGSVFSSFTIAVYGTH